MTAKKTEHRSDQGSNSEPCGWHTSPLTHTQYVDFINKMFFFFWKEGRLKIRSLQCTMYNVRTARQKWNIIKNTDRLYGSPKCSMCNSTLSDETFTLIFRNKTHLYFDHACEDATVPETTKYSYSHYFGWQLPAATSCWLIYQINLVHLAATSHMQHTSSRKWQMTAIR